MIDELRAAWPEAEWEQLPGRWLCRLGKWTGCVTIGGGGVIYVCREWKGVVVRSGYNAARGDTDLLFRKVGDAVRWLRDRHAEDTES